LSIEYRVYDREYGESELRVSESEIEIERERESVCVCSMSAVCDMWSFFIEIEIYRRYEVIIERERERDQ
jgi:hypothetical protein